MFLFIILGVVVLLTLGVLGVLFFMLNKEGKKEEPLPVSGLDQFKKELSSQIFEQSDLKVVDKDSDIIPVFTPKVTLGPTPMSPLDLSQGQNVAKPSPEDEAYKKRAQQLEDELLAISKKADGQSEEAKQLIATLTQENESLKAQQANLEQAQQKLVELQGEAVSLKTENGTLQTQLEATNAKVQLLEDQMAAVKIQMGEEISRANATVTELTREKEALLAAPKPDADQAALHQELETLKTELTQLKQKCEELEKANYALQYELIKAKAQSSGLERIGHNYKNQYEELLARTQSAPH